MVKRKYNAILTIEALGRVINGEWHEGDTTTIVVKGHYDSASDSRVAIRRNSYGDEKQVSGSFYTGKKPVLEGVPVRLTIEEIGIDVPVICWDSYQSHSVIFV